MFGLDKLDTLFVIWAFFLQVVLIIHFAVRKRFFDSYALKFGWIVYALCLPSAIISIILLVGGKAWFFWTHATAVLLQSQRGPCAVLRKRRPLTV